MDEFTQRLVKQLTAEEGRRPTVYLDSKGIPTAGVGRNMRDVGLRPDEMDLMLANDIQGNIDFLNNYAWYRAQSDVRRAALLDMAFMGPEKLLHFTSMIHYLTTGEPDKASGEVRNSKWYQDVGANRGERIAGMIASGSWPSDIPYP